MNPSPQRFKVEMLGQAGPDMARLAGRAEEVGLRELYLDVLRLILECLETQPREWGDPYENYRGLNAVRYGRTVLPANIRVKYTVHNTEPLVWITSIVALPGSPFA